jgi:hypothetical protein
LLRDQLLRSQKRQPTPHGMQKHCDFDVAHAPTRAAFTLL